MRVYIAGPYTKGDVAVNVRNAIEAANQLMDHGHFPFIPHLNHFVHLLFPRPYEDWLALDNVFLPYCQALVRLPGESLGADKEVMLAKSLNIPVYAGVGDLLCKEGNGR